MNKNHSKEYYMKQALKQAKKAYSIDEVPIGAVIVKNNEIISRAYNQREKNHKSTAHSEIIAIEKACKKLNSWRLNNCEIYVTVEPCPMCAGAILNSRMKKVYFGALDEKSGAVVSNLHMLDLDKTFCNHKVEYESELLKDECQDLLKDFFSKLRERNK
ncbi:MAG: tRNA adenosine(34) deaminase TadA [Clostridia bacterium]|nr:tRNA adenosine(34) deaminase TadA [Clostridia bacterium]